MIEKFLNREEKKIFSKRYLNKIKKEDFFSYLEMEEALLESLKDKYKRDNYENKITEIKIMNQQEYVDKLNLYYYDVVLLNKNSSKSEEKITQEFDDLLKPFKKIQK
ncbi:hypothetical protein [Spiroplasma taiwanense]|uniref:Uncharacterized protein n=1 Tax=Spiroplasma taiwanense CT-1 TaxID=1276220 RepID=S5LTW9_9MOLU|nr:hypothetical protein [Spiroplasma taiwanense]AGR41164.1 hypothetical protein STAIW_v1c05390 [Spiroplasma taiwanense CT-1]